MQQFPLKTPSRKAIDKTHRSWLGYRLLIISLKRISSAFMATWCYGKIFICLNVTFCEFIIICFSYFNRNLYVFLLLGALYFILTTNSTRRCTCLHRRSQWKCGYLQRPQNPVLFDITIHINPLITDLIKPRFQTFYSCNPNPVNPSSHVTHHTVRGLKRHLSRDLLH
jgi:hypothetical protein